MEATWWDRARCKGIRDLFYEDGDSIRRARAFCAGCRVWRECLAYAVDNVEEYGIWGGLAPAERRRLQGLRGRLALAEADPKNKRDILRLLQVMPVARLASVAGAEAIEQLVEPERRLVG